jgi:hypothetical protein
MVFEDILKPTYKKKGKDISIYKYWLVLYCHCFNNNLYLVLFRNKQGYRRLGMFSIIQQSVLNKLWVDSTINDNINPVLETRKGRDFKIFKNIFSNLSCLWGYQQDMRDRVHFTSSFTFHKRCKAFFVLSTVYLQRSCGTVGVSIVWPVKCCVCMFILYGYNRYLYVHFCILCMNVCTRTYSMYCTVKSGSNARFVV